MSTLIAITSLAMTLGTDAEPTPVIHVRLYLSANVPRLGSLEALRTVRSILGHAGVVTDGIVCTKRTPHLIEVRCDTPLGPGDLAVRLVPGEPRLGRPRSEALGDAVVDTQARTGALATVYWRRVVDLSRACGCALASVLGRVVAHEIGHLLLGTNAHSSRGLMRAAWNRRELTANQTDDWLFAADEAKVIKRAAQVRLDPAGEVAH